MPDESRILPESPDGLLLIVNVTSGAGSTVMDHLYHCVVNNNKYGMQYDCERENLNGKKSPLALHNPIFQNVHTFPNAMTCVPISEKVLF